MVIALSEMLVDPSAISSGCCGPVLFYAKRATSMLPCEPNDLNVVFNFRLIVYVGPIIDPVEAEVFKKVVHAFRQWK